MVLKEKRFAPPKMHHVQGDPRRTWPSLERLIAEQEAHYQNGSAQEVPEEEPRAEDDNQDRPAYRADSLIVPIDPQVAAHQFPDVDPPQIPKPVKLPAERLPQAKLRHQPPRDWNTQHEEHQRRRRKRPLEEATSYEMARLYAWAYYRLQRLAVQIEAEIAAKQAEVERLQAKSDGGKKDTNSVRQPSPTQRHDLAVTTPESDAQADLDVAPGAANTTRKAMTIPTQRHAHADEGMAPRSVSVEQTTSAAAANERGPP